MKSDDGPVGNSDEIRARLIRLVRQRGKRIIGKPPDRPSDWKPQEVRQEDGCCFTDLLAWDLIEYLLDTGCELTQVVLRKPPGRVAYEMMTQLPYGEWVYVKLELGDGDRVIYGRSFHPPEHISS